MNAFHYNDRMRFGNFAILILVGFVLSGCAKPLTPDDLIGTYTFRSDEIQETLQLKSGGVYEQEIRADGKSFNAKGEWSIKEPRHIVFRGAYLVRYSKETFKTIFPPKEYSLFNGYWLSRTRTIWFDEERKYFVTRDGK